MPDGPRKHSKIIKGNIYKFFRKLAYTEEARKNINFTQVKKLTVEACGISEMLGHHISSTLTSADIRGMNVALSRTTVEYYNQG